MFFQAKQIWLKGREKEKNVFAVIRASVDRSENAVLHIGGTAFFRVSVDGVYIANGPARAAEGYIREDEYVIPDGTKEITIEAVGYYCKSLATVLQPSFVIAEIQSGGRVLFATDETTEIFTPPHKLQKTERYSVQRHFTEVYDERGPKRTDERFRVKAEVVEPAFTVLPRRAPYPDYLNASAKEVLSAGDYTIDETIHARKYRYSWAEVPESWGIYAWDEIPYHPHYFIQQQRRTITDRHLPFPITLSAGRFAIVSLGRIEAGFLTASLDCEEETDVVIAFAEHSESETFEYPNMNVHNALEWILPAGHHELRSFEPYTAAIVLIEVKSGKSDLCSLGVCTYETGDASFCRPAIRDPELRKIYDAAVRNYQHNALDLFMDCPSRERAGWLGDGYFTAKAAYYLTGKTETEDAHLENMRLYINHGELPEGAWPETYPSDIPGVGDHGGKKIGEGGTFIPQFELILLLEISEYLTERGHLGDAPLFREMTDRMLGFFQRYENEEELLERLPSWNFVEWSKANEWTYDVNYPTNALYSEALFRFGKIYENPEWSEKAERIRKAILRESFDGRCFRDHAVRNEEGKLVVQPEKSEACQYYMLLFADPDVSDPKYAELLRMIREDFAFGRPYDSDILPSEIIIGLYYRMALLRKWGEKELLSHDIKAIFGKMYEGTGTLWEYLSGKGSRDHGMCSYLTTLIAFIEGDEV